MVILRLFVDFITSAILLLLICLLVAFFIAKIRKAESKKVYFKKAAWVALVISILGLLDLPPDYVPLVKLEV